MGVDPYDAILETYGTKMQSIDLHDAGHGRGSVRRNLGNLRHQDAEQRPPEKVRHCLSNVVMTRNFCGSLATAPHS